MRVITAAVLCALAGTILQPSHGAKAQSTVQDAGNVGAPRLATEISARRYGRRPPLRLRVYPYYESGGVYPRYYPGRNAVRQCTANYVQEYRPSGTVIVPHMNCFWRPG